MKVAVIGIGTAGLQTLAYFQDTLPNHIDIYSIHNPEQKILGIGESTTTFLPLMLSRSCGFTMLNDADKLDATTKHGVKYVNWRENNFNSHILPPYHGIHFNNFKLNELVLGRLRKEKGFYEIHGDIKSINQDESSVTLQIDDEAHTFDYIVDCRGYPDDYTNYELLDYLPVNSAMVHTVSQPGTWNYTYHQATKNGWMFGIPLQTRQGWGYLYNKDITSKEEAREDLQSLMKEPLQTREFSWKNYYKKNVIDGRVISNGNRALFFEPIEALSGTFYEAVGVEAVNVIVGESTASEANARLVHTAETYATFVCFVYHGGSTFDTEFWKKTVDKTTKALHNSYIWKDVKARLQSLKATGIDDERIILKPLSTALWKLIDKEMGYNYFQ
jgi:hypothetical protein